LAILGKCLKMANSNHWIELDEDGDAHLVAFDKNAVYGVELAFPECDDDAYRVDAVQIPIGMGASRQSYIRRYFCPS